jgi:hypothetical protein
MVQQHFRGVDMHGATTRLTHSIATAFWDLYGGQTEQEQQTSDRALALREEGWTPLFDENGRGCFWRHQSGVTVNSNGGFFPSFDAATNATYESQTRVSILQSK